MGLFFLNFSRSRSPSPQKPLPSKNEIKEISQYIAQEIVAEKYSGPIPAPEALRQYGDINPDFPDRIIQMAEKEMKHRHRMEEKEFRRLPRTIYPPLSDFKKPQHRTSINLPSNTVNPRFTSALNLF
ncbi:MAG: DUF2335 domain-containing protein [Thermodesulfobacteriota bacterium]